MTTDVQKTRPYAAAEYRWVWNTPNVLTMGRFLLVPFEFTFLVTRRLDWALVTYFLAGASDFLDGYLARRREQRTPFGAMMDPLADKVTIVATFIALIYLGIIPMWLALLVISRDVLIVIGINLLVAMRRKVTWKAIPIGKVTTVCQNATILAAILHHFFAFPVLIFNSLAVLTAGLTVASFVEYVRLWKKFYDRGRAV